MSTSTLTTLCVALLLASGNGAKQNGQKNKKPKQIVPQIDCDVRAGKISIPEFIAKCPANCRETKHPVYGADIYASISSVCNAAIHSGVITNSGGKVIVRKVAGQSVYRGSFSNGVRSLSLPKWRESFIVSVGKPKKGVIYPSILEFLPSRSTSVKTEPKKSEQDTKNTKNSGSSSEKTSDQGHKEAKASTTAMTPTTTVTEPTTTPAPTTTTTTPRPATTSTQLPTTTPTQSSSPAPSSPAKPRVAPHKVREAGQVQNSQAKGPTQAFRGTSSYASRNSPRISPGFRRQDPISTYKRQSGAPANPAYNRVQLSATERNQQAVQSHPSTRFGEQDTNRKIIPETTHSQGTVEPFDAWKPEVNPFNTGIGAQEQELIPRVTETVSQGDPNCKVDIAFLMDGSWSIGKRRFKIQKDFLAEVSQVLNIGIAGPMMGIIQYGDDPMTEFSLKTYSSSRDVKPAIEKIVQKGGLSNVGKALTYINKHFFSDSSGNRGGAPNVAVVLVDGWPTDKVEEASRLARESGINIFFVTIEGPDENEKQNVVEPNFVDKAVCRTSGFFSLSIPSWFGLRKTLQPLVKRVCDTDRLVCSKTCLNANDIAFVIDGSSSVGTSNFRTVLQFVANITKEFEISDTDTRVGAVQYTYEQRLEFAFGQYDSKPELLNAIKRIDYWSGGTSTGAAITYAAEQLFSKSKPNKRKIMIVITDGRSYDDVRAPALAVHRTGVIAYSVGIAWAAQDELQYIATDPDKDHSFFVDEFDNLYKFVPKIIQNICQEFNSQPRN
ncbi:vitrin isoform X10 [Lepisosteus oculatus]|uniref:vitrin isoform X10 n=1 Tax=Lepisosteus oculatus TaxID=7918 RepID=UPI0035F51898